MNLHIGGDVLINKKSIVGIMDIENTSTSKKTRDFLAKSEKTGKVIYVSDNMPKSFIITKEKDKVFVYISPLSSATLYKRYLSRL